MNTCSRFSTSVIIGLLCFAHSMPLFAASEISTHGMGVVVHTPDWMPTNIAPRYIAYGLGGSNEVLRATSNTFAAVASVVDGFAERMYAYCNGANTIAAPFLSSLGPGESWPPSQRFVQRPILSALSEWTSRDFDCVQLGMRLAPYMPDPGPGQRPMMYAAYAFSSQWLRQAVTDAEYIGGHPYSESWRTVMEANVDVCPQIDPTHEALRYPTFGIWWNLESSAGWNYICRRWKLFEMDGGDPVTRSLVADAALYNSRWDTEPVYSLKIPLCYNADLPSPYVYYNYEIQHDPIDAELGEVTAEGCRRQAALLRGSWHGQRLDRRPLGYLNHLCAEMESFYGESESWQPYSNIVCDAYGTLGYRGEFRESSNGLAHVTWVREPQTLSVNIHSETNGTLFAEYAHFGGRSDEFGDIVYLEEITNDFGRVLLSEADATEVFLEMMVGWFTTPCYGAVLFRVHVYESGEIVVSPFAVRRFTAPDYREAANEAYDIDPPGNFWEFQLPAPAIDINDVCHLGTSARSYVHCEWSWRPNGAVRFDSGTRPFCDGAADRLVGAYVVDYFESMLTLTNITRTGENAVIARAGGWQTLRNTRCKAEVRGGTYTVTGAGSVPSSEQQMHAELNAAVLSARSGQPLSIEAMTTIVESGLTAPTNTYVSAKCIPLPAGEENLTYFWFFQVDSHGIASHWKVGADWAAGVASTNDISAITLDPYPVHVATMTPQVDLEHADNLYVATNKPGWSVAARRHIITRVDLKRHNMRKTGGDNR